MLCRPHFSDLARPCKLVIACTAVGAASYDKKVIVLLVFSCDLKLNITVFKSVFYFFERLSPVISGVAAAAKSDTAFHMLKYSLVNFNTGNGAISVPLNFRNYLIPIIALANSFFAGRLPCLAIIIL